MRSSVWREVSIGGGGGNSTVSTRPKTERKKYVGQRIVHKRTCLPCMGWALTKLAIPNKQMQTNMPWAPKRHLVI